MAEPVPDLCQAWVFSSILFQYFKHRCEWAGYPRKQRAIQRGKNKGGQGSDSEFVITKYTYVKVGKFNWHITQTAEGKNDTHSSSGNS